MHRLILPLLAAFTVAALSSVVVFASGHGDTQASGNVVVRLYDPAGSSEDSSGEQVGNSSRPKGSGGHRLPDASNSDPEIFILKDDGEQALGPLPQTGVCRSRPASFILAGYLCASAGLVGILTTGSHRVRRKKR